MRARIFRGNTVAGYKIFCGLDLAGAYQQLAVTDKSMELLTINTHRGFFRFQSLPFGVSSASSMFQRVMDELIKDLKGVFGY